MVLRHRLLLLAEERGCRVYEVPVDCFEDLDCRVEIIPTILRDGKGLLRMWTRRVRYRVLRIAALQHFERHSSCSLSPYAAFEQEPVLSTKESGAPPQI